jgi:hypothetical protein
MSIRPGAALPAQYWQGVPSVDWSHARMMQQAAQAAHAHPPPVVGAPKLPTGGGGTVRLLLLLCCLVCVGISATVTLVLVSARLGNEGGAPPLARARSLNEEASVIAGAVAGAHAGAEAGGRVSRRSALLRRLADAQLEGGDGAQSAAATFPEWFERDGEVRSKAALADLARALAELARETQSQKSPV